MAPMVTQAGGRWRAPNLVVFETKPPKNPCEEGGDGGVAGSFYCAQDRTLYLSTFEAGEVTTAYVQEARKVPGVLAADAKTAGVPESQLRKGLAGQGQATILTHELAHQVLVQTGYQRWFDQRVAKYEPGTKRYDAYGFAPETAADCLTGAALNEAKRRGLLRMNGLDLWGSRAWLAQTDGFNRERPLAAPFRYRNEWKGEQYRGYGGAYWRLRAFDLGWQRGASDAVGYCTRAAAEWKGITATPRAAG